MEQRLLRLPGQLGPPGEERGARPPRTPFELGDVGHVVTELLGELPLGQGLPVPPRPELPLELPCLTRLLGHRHPRPRFLVQRRLRPDGDLPCGKSTVTPIDRLNEVCRGQCPLVLTDLIMKPIDVREHEPLDSSVIFGLSPDLVMKPFRIGENQPTHGHSEHLHGPGEHIAKKHNLPVGRRVEQHGNLFASTIASNTAPFVSLNPETRAA